MYQNMTFAVKLCVTSYPSIDLGLSHLYLPRMNEDTALRTRQNSNKYYISRIDYKEIGKKNIVKYLTCETQRALQ